MPSHAARDSSRVSALWRRRDELWQRALDLLDRVRPGGQDPRQPRPAGHQRHGRKPGRRIADHLRLIVGVPLVTVVAFAGLAVLTTTQQSLDTADLHELVLLGGDAGRLAHVLQDERAAAASVLTGNSTNAQPRLEDFAKAGSVTDGTIRDYRARRARIDEQQVDAPDLIHRIDAGLNALSDLRNQVRSGAQASVTAVAFSYRIVVADLLRFREAVARAGAPPDIADDIRAAAALSKAAEAVGQQQVAVLRAMPPGQLTPALRQEITAARATFTEWIAQFTDLARPEWRGWYEQASVGGEVLAAQRLQDDVARTQLAVVDIEPAKWIGTMASWVDRLFDVQQRIDRAIAAEVAAVHTSQVRKAIIEAIGVALALAAAVVLTSVVVRRITHRLRRLHDAARTIAYERLPAVVAELRAAPPGTVRPHDVANRSVPEVSVDGADEIAEVAQAFEAVHREAVRIAGEQAVMRSNMAEIFVHLSRREQRLVDAVLAQVDRVERDETDPDRLQELYQLDHLATRMARINLSLLVLGGSGAARVRREDTSLGKVLQAAISQIEHYTRVRFGAIDNDVAVVSEAVDEVVHLLAELIDNATSYSSPESEVWVAARALGDRIIIQIGDIGVGLSAQRREQLNRLLAQPPAIDIAAVRAMGLTVVGHIAARYRIRVELRPGQGIGTVAEVTLPSTVFRAIGATQPDLVEPSVSPSWAPPPDLVEPSVSPSWAPPPDPPAPPPPSPAPTSSPPWAPLPPLRPAGAEPNGGKPEWPPFAEPATDTFVRLSDDTAELPIFQEVSGWFRIGSTSSGSGNWRSNADAGWRAAARAATPAVTTTTAAGLPVRHPQRHLVPGAAPPGAGRPPGAARRDPAAIAAAMSAYARGVAGRRNATPADLAEAELSE
jgi:hypothetical protein